MSDRSVANLRLLSAATLVVVVAAGIALWPGDASVAADGYRLLTSTGDAAHFACDMRHASDQSDPPAGRRFDADLAAPLLSLPEACIQMAAARARGACLDIPAATVDKCNVIAGSRPGARLGKRVIVLVAGEPQGIAGLSARVRKFSDNQSLAQAGRPAEAQWHAPVNTTGASGPAHPGNEVQFRHLILVVPDKDTKLEIAACQTPALKPQAAMLRLATVKDAQQAEATCSGVVVEAKANPAKPVVLLTAKHCVQDADVYAGSVKLTCAPHDQLDLASCDLPVNPVSQGAVESVSAQTPDQQMLAVTIAGFGLSYRKNGSATKQVIGAFCAGPARYFEGACGHIPTHANTAPVNKCDTEAKGCEVFAQDADSGGAVFLEHTGGRTLLGIISTRNASQQTAFVDLRTSAAWDFLNKQNVALPKQPTCPP